MLKSIIAVTLVAIAAIESGCPQKKKTGPTVAQKGDVIAIEAERYYESEGFKGTAVGTGRGLIKPGKERAEATYKFQVNETGYWYLWIYAYAPDVNNNTFTLRVDDRPLSAPADHPYHGVTTLYLEPGGWTWTPEWKGAGEGRHAGPIVLYLSQGEHTITIVKRLTHRPTFDKIWLTKTATPPVDGKEGNTPPGG